MADNRQIGTLISAEELLTRAERIRVRKDFTGGFGTPDLGAAVSVEQATRFIRLMTDQQELLNEVRTITSTKSKWEEPVMDFATRIMVPGIEGDRVAAADRKKPTITIVQFSTVLIKGEVLVSREAMEDVLTGEGEFVDALEEAIAFRAGQDVEELLLNGDTALNAADPYLDLLDGWRKRLKGVGGHVLNAAGMTSYITVFGQLIASIPNKYKKNVRDWRLWVPWAVEENYRNELADRGTPLGDLALTERQELTFRGIPIKPLGQMPVTAGTPDTGEVIFTRPDNLLAGFHREVEMDSDYSKREGNTAFLVSCRPDARVVNLDPSAIATNVDAEPAL